MCAKILNEQWNPDRVEFSSGAQITRNILNDQRTEQLVSVLRDAIQPTDPSTGLNYAWFKDDGSSSTDAVVIFNPFGNGLSDSMLLRGYFTQLAAQEEGVTDEAGNSLSVFVLSAPTFDSEPRLSQDDISAVCAGDLGPVAREMLKSVVSKDIGRVCLNGFSLGADIALAAGMVAPEGNLDVAGLSIGDPAGVTDRNRFSLALGMSKTSMGDVRRAASDSEIIAQEDLVAVDKDFVLNLVCRANRLYIAKALGKRQLATSLSAIGSNLPSDIPLTLGFGEESKVTPVESVYDELGNVQLNGDDDMVLTAIRVKGANHAWGDNMMLLYKLYSRSLRGS